MEPDRIVKIATEIPEYYNDLVAIGRRAFPDQSIESAVHNVAVFICNYNQMWRDVGNEDISRRAPIFYLNQTLYLDLEHKVLNPSLNESDYLMVFKEFERKFAARQHTSSCKLDWEVGQDRLAELVKSLNH